MVHGKDSLQAKLAEEAVSRRLFELDLERHGITGDIRDQLIAQYEAAATLEDQIVAAQPAFQGLNTIIDSISKSWADWVVRGFKDFKSFTKSVGDAFKQLLVQMIATAARNKIAISLGLSGGLPGLAGADGGGGGMGQITSLLKPLFKPIMNGLKGIGQSLGLIASPSIAGGAAAVAAGGAVAGGAGGFGAFGLAGAGAAGGGAAAGLGGAAALAGPVGIGLAAVIAMGAPLLFAAFMTKTKELDKGIRIAIDALDVTAESFLVLQKSKFFGLSKKTVHRSSALDEETANPIIEALNNTRDSLRQTAEVLGLSTGALDTFRHSIDISLKGLNENQQAQKLSEAFTKMADEMAKATLEGTKLAEKFGDTAEAMQALAVTFATVNEVLNQLSMPQFATGEEGVRRRCGLISTPRRAGRFIYKLALQFQELFHSEAERVEQTVRLLTQSLAGLNVALYRRA